VTEIIVNCRCYAGPSFICRALPQGPEPDCYTATTGTPVIYRLSSGEKRTDPNPYELRAELGPKGLGGKLLGVRGVKPDEWILEQEFGDLRRGTPMFVCRFCDGPASRCRSPTYIEAGL